MSNTNNDEEENEEELVDVQWGRDAKQIQLPEGMDCDEGIKWLQRKRDEMQREVAIDEVFEGAYPTDGAYALQQALRAIYGWTNLKPTESLFGSNPPRMLGIKTGPDSSTQVPWGQMQIPGVDGYLETGFRMVDNRPVFTLNGVVKRKNEKEIHKVAEKTREYLRENSIYRGKAIKIDFPSLEEVGSLEDFEPDFIDTSSVDPEELIFSRDVEKKIESNLFTPIKHADYCRDAGIPLKRGVLLAGKYGVGKTMTAYVAARYCVENDFTFIYVEDVNDLATAIQFAKMYAPAMVFAEDLDSAIGTSRRDSDVNEILNTIDGVDSKDQEILVCLTTNHVDRINKAMLRPGRLDATIKVTPPDAEAAVKLVRQYARGRLADNEDLSEVGEKLAGMIPAVIQEVVERAKLTAVSNLPDGADESEIEVTADDLMIAASTMKDQLDLLEPETPDTRSDLEKAADRLGGHISSGLLENRVKNDKIESENGEAEALPPSATDELVETADQPS